MGFIFEERPSDSPFIEKVTGGHTEGTGTTIRPAESHWHMVFTRYQGGLHPIVTGPLTTAGVVSFSEGAEILWVKFKLAAFMPPLPTRNMLDSETILPGASGRSFYLKGSAWQLPSFENVETFIERLVRQEILVRDPLVDEVLQRNPLESPPLEMASRTVRHRFRRATGLSQNNILQIERAQQARALLEQGKSILDTIDALGYFDQPHLTRSLKQWVGHTPGEIIRMSQPNCQPDRGAVLVPNYETPHHRMVPTI